MVEVSPVKVVRGICANSSWFAEVVTCANCGRDSVGLVADLCLSFPAMAIMTSSDTSEGKPKTLHISKRASSTSTSVMLCESPSICRNIEFCWFAIIAPSGLLPSNLSQIDWHVIACCVYPVSERSESPLPDARQPAETNFLLVVVVTGQIGREQLFFQNGSVHQVDDDQHRRNHRQPGTHGDSLEQEGQ